MKNTDTISKYKIELWVCHEVVDTFKTDDFITAKDRFRIWFNNYDNNCNKGHTMFYANNKLMSIEWVYKNILERI